MSKARVELSARGNNWSLVRELAITDFKLKYQGSLIGYLWSLVKPLAIFGVLYLVFTVFVRIGSGIDNYPLYLLVGIVLWSYFAEATSIALHSIVDRGDLIRKVYFPKFILLIASSISATITLFLNLAIIVIFMALSNVGPTLKMLLFPLILLELYSLALGVSLLLSSLYVRFRDLWHLWDVGL
jgi:ABC-2 type transport system permease protein